MDASISARRSLCLEPETGPDSEEVTIGKVGDNVTAYAYGTLSPLSINFAYGQDLRDSYR
jgi:hypothetical protein